MVGVSLVPGTGPLQILRSLRILRVLRLIPTVRRLRQLTEALLAAIPSIGWILFMLGMVFYVFAVIGTEVFGARFPDWFGSLGASLSMQAVHWAEEDDKRRQNEDKAHREREEMLALLKDVARRIRTLEQRAELERSRTA